MVLVSFRAHIISGVINLIAAVCTGVALFTCHWLDYNVRNISAGLIKLSSCTVTNCTCRYISDSLSWRNATLAFIIMAFIFQILGVLHLLGTSVYRKFNNHVLKVDTSLTTLSLLCLIVTVTVFGISADDDFVKFSFGYSYIMACVAAGISLFAYLPAAHAWRKIRRCGDCECEVFEW